jgi:hypothetical protein
MLLKIIRAQQKELPMGAGRKVTNARVKELRHNITQGASLKQATMKAGHGSQNGTEGPQAWPTAK